MRWMRTGLVWLAVAGGGIAIVQPAGALASYGVKAFDVQIAANAPEVGDTVDLPASAGSYHQAGGHPYAIVTHIEWNNQPDPSTDPELHGTPEPEGDIKDALVDLPAGLVGNASALPTCTPAQLSGASTNILEYTSECPVDSQVGVVRLYWGGQGPGGLGAGNGVLPLFNMAHPTGIAARFGFNVAKTLVYFDATTGPERGYRITVGSNNTPQALRIYRSDVTFWGVPGAPTHDHERCNSGTTVMVGTASDAQCGGASGTIDGPHKAGMQPVPLLTMPTSCPGEGGGEEWLLRTNSWEEPGRIVKASLFSHLPPFAPDPGAPGAQQGTTGCEVVPFNPDFAAAPTEQSAATSSGLTVLLTFPTDGLLNPTGIAQSHLKKAVVVLPQGMTINPSQGEGLQACSPEQYAQEEVDNASGEGCPSTSKIGTVVLHTPLLTEELQGDVYIAQPYTNPFGTLIALYIVIKNHERGILVKVPARVDPDPNTGQLVTTFDELPQLPVESFEFHFREGVRAPLVTPALCGTYTTEGRFMPWSDPSKTVVDQSTFEITKGVDEGLCPSGGVPPFKPQVIAGTQSNAAATYSPFYLRIVRGDDEQEITKFTSVFPQGLTGNLTGIPYCSDAAIEAARAATGREELSKPSCPAASEIGHTVVGAGVGTVLAQTPGKIYLAGPYHGSALSIVSVTSATVGPFDLGTVVVRFALHINPVTAQVEVDGSGSDPIPHIIRGIVVHVRDIRVYIDRPKFIANPTSCNPTQIQEAITGAGADPASTSDDQTVTASSAFQASDCANLKFKPVFKASTSGKTSRTNGASLHVKLAYPTAPFGTQANIHYVKVDLPKQLPSRLTTLQKACQDTVFDANPAACPTLSRVGTAKAITPILPEPLTGPAYFVSHGGAKFPELIIVLQGYGFTIDLHGETFISPAGITSSTFDSVPDEPVTSFELTLPQGPHSALAANGNLCASKLTMPTAFTAQNGLTVKQNTRITITGCPRHKTHNAKASRRHKHHKPHPNPSHKK